MKNIVKHREPIELRDHRKAGGSFEDAQGESRWKERLRDALLRDQGHLCCYCMQAIEPTSTKIEHYRCQERHPELQLAYDNLFAACPGGQGLPPRMQHCDTAKGNRDTVLDPAGNPELHLRYTIDGKVRSNNTLIEHELNAVLNLNAPDLVRARKQTIDALVSKLEALGGREKWKAEVIASLCARWERRDVHDHFLPFAQLGIYFLKRWGRRPDR